MLTELGSRLDTAQPKWVFTLVLIPLWILYLATATFQLPYHIDPFTNVLTAWSFATDGDPYLDEAPKLVEEQYFGNLAWMVEAQGHIVSQYPPGAALLAAPFYLLDRSAEVVPMQGANDPRAPRVPIPIPSLAVAAVVASLATALAMACMALVFIPLSNNRTALAAAYVFGLATSAWAVASDSLWQHGPAMLWIAFGLLLASRKHWLSAGFAFGAAILTRPHTALIAATTGLWVGATRRKPRATLLVGVGAVVGLGILVTYNWALFGSPSIAGGYGSAFTDRAATSGLGWYAKNIVGALLDPEKGLLIWAPFLVVLIAGIPSAWRASPDWVRGSALGGFLYLLLQLKANRYSGGAGFFSYRYPLEMLTAAAPLFLLSWRHWVSKSRLRSWLLLIGVIFAVAAQAMGASF